MDSHGLQQADLTEIVIGSAFEISTALGAGFLEKIYERAMVVEEKLIVALKCVNCLSREHLAQCIN